MREGFDWPAAIGHWLEVPTHHHQAVDRLGTGLLATAWAADGTVEAVEFTSASAADGTVEAVEFTSAGAADGAEFAIGVQWHPEEGEDPRLFRALIGAARRSSRSRRAGLPGLPVREHFAEPTGADVKDESPDWNVRRDPRM